MRHGPPWTLPRDVTLDELQRLRNRIRNSLGEPNPSRSRCWAWVGEMNGLYPCVQFRGQKIAATRVSWAIHRSDPLPGKITRIAECTGAHCVNPDHLVGHHPTGKRATPPTPAPTAAPPPEPLQVAESPAGGYQSLEDLYEDLKRAEAGHDAPPPRAEDEDTGRGETFEEIAANFHTLDAFAALQFGTTPNKFTPRRLRVQAEDPIQTIEGPKVVALPAGLHEYTPSPAARARYLSISAQELLDIVFAPHTLVVTYPSGAVLISTPGARVLAPDAEAALQGILRAQGKRKVVG